MHLRRALHLGYGKHAVPDLAVGGGQCRPCRTPRDHRAPSSHYCLRNGQLRGERWEFRAVRGVGTCCPIVHRAPGNPSPRRTSPTQMIRPQPGSERRPAVHRHLLSASSAGSSTAPSQGKAQRGSPRHRKARLALRSEGSISCKQGAGAAGVSPAAEGTAIAADWLQPDPENQPRESPERALLGLAGINSAASSLSTGLRVCRQTG